MNVKTTLLAACLLATTSLHAQHFQWAKAFGGGKTDLGTSICIDASGNVYTIGLFSGTADFDPGAGTANLTSSGNNVDIFVQKMDGSGNFLWAKSFGGTGNDWGNSISVDASGNVYTTGFFTGTVDFDPGAGMANLTSSGDRDIFVQKMDASGNFLWAKAFGGISEDWGSSIEVDASGNVYTTGFFQGTADFDPGAGTANLPSAGMVDIFVQKMDASGNFLWAKAFGGTGNEAGNSISVDASGNVYTTGYFEETADFDPGAGIASLTSSGSSDIFVQKMDASGNFLWAKAFGGAHSDMGSSICVDASGNVYTTGYFQGTADFDPGTGTAHCTSVGLYDIFVQKMDGSGNFLWGKAFGGASIERGAAIYVDVSGNVYTTGYFEETVDFDPGVGTANLTSAGFGQDIFVQKMDGSGNFLWAKSFGVAGHNDMGSSIEVDVSGNVYTTGYFAGTVDFDPGAGTTNLISVGSWDIFVQKMSQSPSGIVAIGDGIAVKAYPNPGNGLVQISFEQPLSNVAITVTDLQGKVVYSKQLNTASKEQINIEGSAGVYFLNVTTSEGQSVVKLIKE